MFFRKSRSRLFAFVSVAQQSSGSEEERWIYSLLRFIIQQGRAKKKPDSGCCRALNVWDVCEESALVGFSPASNPGQTGNTGSEEQHGGWFGDGGRGHSHINAEVSFLKGSI